MGADVLRIDRPDPAPGRRLPTTVWSCTTGDAGPSSSTSSTTAARRWSCASSSGRTRSTRGTGRGAERIIYGRGTGWGEALRDWGFADDELRSLGRDRVIR